MKSQCVYIVTFMVILSVTIVKSGKSNSTNTTNTDDIIIEKAKICQKEHKASNDDIKALLDGTTPTSRLAKCLTECLYKLLGLLTKDNKLVPQRLEEIFANDSIKTKNGTTLKSIVKVIAEACSNITHQDSCEQAARVARCMNDEAKKRGFEDNYFK